MEKVRAGLTFHESQKAYKEAVAQGAMHLFEEKYGDVVRVVCFGDWTCELCGGTHVENTADIGTALIVSESSIGSGLRRIDMVVGEAADDLVIRDRELLSELARSFNVSPDALPARMEALRGQLKETERERERLRRERIGSDGVSVKHGRVDFVAQTVDAASVDELKSYADRYLEKVASGHNLTSRQFVIKVCRTDRQYDYPPGGPGGGGKRTLPGQAASRPGAFQRWRGAELTLKVSCASL
jgi:alanyl-tRNA synthetase